MFLLLLYSNFAFSISIFLLNTGEFKLLSFLLFFILLLFFLVSFSSLFSSISFSSSSSSSSLLSSIILAKFNIPGFFTSFILLLLSFSSCSFFFWVNTSNIIRGNFFSDNLFSEIVGLSFDVFVLMLVSLLFCGGL